MKQLHILAVGRNQDILDVVLRLINQHPGWTGGLALSCETALPLLTMEDYEVVLLCAGIGPAEEASFREAVARQAIAPRIIRHFGGGSGLLENEIREALRSQAE